MYRQIQINTGNDHTCIGSFTQTAQARGRTEVRQVFVYKDTRCISAEWAGLRRLIRVERDIRKKGEQSHETAYFIRDIQSNNAAFFANHIRNHWAIENRLHWVKDAIMNEDRSGTTGGMAAENISIIRNIAINLFRCNGHQSVKYAIEMYVNKLEELYNLIYYKSK